MPPNSHHPDNRMIWPSCCYIIEEASLLNEVHIDDTTYEIELSLHQQWQFPLLTLSQHQSLSRFELLKVINWLCLSWSWHWVESTINFVSSFTDWGWVCSTSCVLVDVAAVSTGVDPWLGKPPLPHCWLVTSTYCWWVEDCCWSMAFGYCFQSMLARHVICLVWHHLAQQNYLRMLMISWIRLLQLLWSDLHRWLIRWIIRHHMTRW